MYFQKNILLCIIERSILFSAFTFSNQLKISIKFKSINNLTQINERNFTRF